MTLPSDKPLPYLRLVIYLIILSICGFVAARELFFELAGNVTMATVLSVTKTSKTRTALYLADYEFSDELQVRHVGRAYVPPKTNPFDLVEVQYLRHAPETSRLTPSPAGWLCYGFVALLAAVVFVAEIATRRRRRRRRKHRSLLGDDQAP